MRIFLLFICIGIMGCAAIIRQSDITLTNMTYTGPYCPGGCKADVHYLANTIVEVGDAYKPIPK